MCGEGRWPGVSRAPAVEDDEVVVVSIPMIVRHHSLAAAMRNQAAEYVRVDQNASGLLQSRNDAVAALEGTADDGGVITYRETMTRLVVRAVLTGRIPSATRRHRGTALVELCDLPPGWCQPIHS